MCGIAGVLHFDGREACPERLRAMIAVMHHRGPDAAGIFVDHGTGLAHARLSILDPANGHQPMQSANGALTITFNGEIFNFIELRAELEARGHCFKTRSDTEVILHAYQEYGEKCVEHFNGQWALAIWDKHREQLFLSRDRLGIRPLFYTQVNGQFLFASEIKSLFVLPEVRRELDSHGLSQLFTFWSTIAPTTVFRDIGELPPGRNLVIRHDQFHERTYWQLDYTPADGSIPWQAWAEELRALLIDATQLRLRADVPVGAYLSGGLDSSITVALAQKELNDRLRTFSVSFEDRQFDESGYQKLVVDFLNVEHHAMHCTHESIAEIFPEVVWHTEKPMLRTAPAPLFVLSELVHAAGFKVVLTGEGADEILGGYDIFKEAKVRRFYAGCPNSSLRAALIQKLYPYLPSIQMQSAAMRQAFFRARPEDLTSPFFSHLPRWEMTGQLRRFFSQDYLSHHGQERLYEEIESLLPAAYSEWKSFCQAQYLESVILLPGYILSSQGDRVAMAHSVEGRFPFLDHRLVEFAAKIPPRLKMNGLNEKYLLKQSLGSLVPPPIVARTKQPYRSPDASSFFREDWLVTQQEYVTELLSHQRVKADGIFQPDAVDRLLKKVRSGKATGMRDNMAFVGILSTQLLADRFLGNFPGHDIRNHGVPISMARQRPPLDLQHSKSNPNMDMAHNQLAF